ncbi:MAG: 3'-5' exonuclease [Chthoniobacterales bacterium]
MSSHRPPRPIAPTKADTALLPPFLGLSLERVFVPATQADFAAAAAEIFAAGVAGFDTESKPIFNAGEVNKGPHVVQFALTDRAFIFQLHRLEGVPFVKELLASEKVRKVGFGLSSDHTQIRSRLGIKPSAVVDLDVAFRKLGYRGQIGVRAAVGTVLKQSFPKSKSATTSNWALPRLSPKQLLYAANDAYAALKVYEALEVGRV